MECPHLADLDKLTTSPNLRSLLNSSNNGVKPIHQPQQNPSQLQTSLRGTRSSRSAQVQYHCEVCKSDRSPWMCVLCGQVHCGRYVNSHARKHFLTDNKHFLAICCHSQAAFCYACDEYVINETQSKRILRVLEQFQNNQASPKQNKRKDPLEEANLSPAAKASKIKRVRLAGDPPGGKTILEAANNGGTTQKRKLMQIANVNDNSKPELLFETLRNTIYLLKKSGKSFIIPESLFTMVGKNPRFRGYQQQDAHEFLRYVLDRLDKECSENCPEADKAAKKNQIKNHATMIGNIFGGILQNEVNCLECGFKSNKQDPFLDLSLDIPAQRTASSSMTTVASAANNSQDHPPSSNHSDNSNHSSCNSTTGTANTTTTGDSCHLIDCLSSFIELEELTETELYYCSNCQKKQRSTKRFWIRRLPDVLCLHLKRFRYNNFLRTKIDDFIQFPMQGLDMKRFVMANKHETRGSSSGPTTYDLVAFIEHHGSGLGAGHYTAYCRHEDFWFHFDDSSVTACDESTVKRSKAYILFYNRRTS